MSSLISSAATSRLKSTGENLFQKAMDTVGPTGQRVLKGPAKRKKSQTSDRSNVRSAIQCSIVVIHVLCFHKRVSISKVDVVVPRPTDGKRIREQAITKDLRPGKH
jgi:hypothetical protein